MLVARLDQIRKDDLATAGGKGANLGEMMHLGLPVPGGFCVTAQAYAHQVETWGLSPCLQPLIEAQDWHAVARAAEALMQSHSLAPELEQAVLAAYHQMGSPAVAVRSSATAEDLAGASFAGQQETYLNVVGDAALLQAVRRCWASLWGHRALHYRHQRGVDHLQVTIAVVVQQMVAADAAGVLFTVDPIAQRADRMLIEAAPGLGEAVVSGQVTGDRYRLDRKDRLRVVDQEIRTAGRPVMSPAQLASLGELGLRLEAHYGCPQDVEFALAGGELYILQTRPVTTFAGVEPEPIPPAPRQNPMMARMAQQLAAERYPIAPKPLDEICMDVIMAGMAVSLRSAGYKVTEADEMAARAPHWREAYAGPYAGFSVRLLGAGLRMKRLLNREWCAWWEQEQVPRLVAASRPVDLAALSDEELIARADHVHATWRAVLTERFEVIPAYVGGEALLRGLTAVAVGKAKSGSVMLDLVGGVHTHTHEMNRALWRLSRLARQEPAIAAAIREGRWSTLSELPTGTAFLEEFGGFLAAYGHRAGTAWYISCPTWGQEPARVWQMLQGLVALDLAPADTGRERHETAHRLVAERLRRWPLLPKLFRWIHERYRLLHVFRENSNLDLTRPLGALQSVAAEFARRLGARGLLQSPEEVHYLYLDEVRTWLTGRAPAVEEARKLIARRRRTYQEVNGRWQAGLFQAAGTGDVLRGVGASPGVVRAKARLIRGEHQFGRLQAGEVLVCPYSNPSWTPLFASAAAVVAETGGAMSHAAIVAREYGIPAVMGVAGALQRIEDGQELLVDGNTGRVLLKGDV